MKKPLAIDLFCGLGGWTDGLLAEGYDVVGFDIERHVYGEHRYPAQLVVQDVLSLNGSQFRGADLIVASPPCQEYSYMAMPWSRAKAKATAIREDQSGQAMADLNRLFNACFRLQREACEAAGKHIPLIIENVKGAQPWVGRSRWNYGSFYLWGDVPALMPPTFGARKFNPDRKDHPTKNTGGSWLKVAHNTTSGKGRNPDGRDPMWERGFQQTAADQLILRRDGLPHKHQLDPGENAVKHRGSGAAWFDTGLAGMPSKSIGRKMASAMIAKIPLPLSRYIASTFHPGRGPQPQETPWTSPPSSPNCRIPPRSVDLSPEVPSTSTISSLT